MEVGTGTDFSLFVLLTLHLLLVLWFTDVRGSHQQFAWITKLLMNMQPASSVQEMHNSETATSASP